jgi:hypothetical protein
MSFRLLRSSFAPLIASTLLFAAPRAGAQAPSDLMVIAQGGAVAPDHPIAVVILDSLGTGVYCGIDPPDRLTLDCSAQTALILTGTDLDSIWSAAITNGFFGLDSVYVDTTLAGGTWAELEISGGGQANKVFARNLAVPGFDAVLIAINSVLPPANRILTNETLP